MPDSGQIPRQDRHVGGGGLSSGVSPLIAEKDKLFEAVNVHCDTPGFISKRRGLQDLNVTNHYSALSGLSTSYLPRRIWCFDNHLFVYLEDSTHGAIAAYDLIGGTWQIVVAAGSKLEMDSATRKVSAKVFDRTMIVLTSLGPYRLSALYAASGTSQFSYANAFRAAGIPRALDPRCKNSASGGATDSGFVAVAGYNWLLDQCAVAYRVCWIMRDENGILGTGAPSGRIVVRNTSGAATTTRLKIPIPSIATSPKLVLQIYRTNVMPADGTGSIPDPGDDMFLAGEYSLTATDVSNTFAMYNDVSFDGILGDELYTNESQEGPDQARFQPPIARAIERFGNCAWYADVTERQRLTMKILAVDSGGIGLGIRIGDRIVAGDITMEGVATAAEETQKWNFAVDATTGSGSEIIRVLKTTESFVYKYNMMSNAWNGKYYAYNLTGPNDIVGVIGFEERSIGGSAPCYIGLERFDAPTSVLPYPGVTGQTSDPINATKVQVTTNAPATQATLHNGAASFFYIAGDKVVVSPYGLSNAAGTGTNRFANTRIPAGEYTVVSSTLVDVVIDITGAGATGAATDASDATHGGFFFSTYDKFYDNHTHARSGNARIKNRLYWSSPGEFECAPVVNFKDLGNADAKINAIVATITSLFVFKEDGVWRARGTDGEWEFEYMDPSCSVIAPHSPAVVMGDVYAYSTNGVVRVSEGGVTKISTEVGTFLDAIVRTWSSVQTDAIWLEGVAHDEDQAYLLNVPQTSGYGGGFYTYRYHVPSKKWSVYYYPDNSTPFSSGAWSVGSMCMARATRYDASGSAQNYISRLVVAHNSVANCIGIERREETFRDLCDYDVGYQTISSYDTTNNKIILAAGCPAKVAVGDVIWARNPGSPNATYRAPILAISTTNVANDTLTIKQGGTITALSSWPAVGTVQAVFMTAISPFIAYISSMASDGFSTTHVSDVSLQVGSYGRFTDLTINFFTDAYGINQAGSAVTLNGFGTSLWDTLKQGQLRSGSIMSITGFNTLVSQEAQRAGRVLVEITNSHAWEPLDIAAAQISMFGESKIRRGTGT